MNAHQRNVTNLANRLNELCQNLLGIKLGNTRFEFEVESLTGCFRFTNYKPELPDHEVVTIYATPNFDDDGFTPFCLEVGFEPIVHTANLAWHPQQSVWEYLHLVEREFTSVQCQHKLHNAQHAQA